MVRVKRKCLGERGMLFIVSEYEPLKRALKRKGKVFLWRDVGNWGAEEWDKELTVCLPVVWRCLSGPDGGKSEDVDEPTDSAIKELSNAVSRGRKVVVVFPDGDHYEKWLRKVDPVNTKVCLKNSNRLPYPHELSGIWVLQALEDMLSCLFNGINALPGGVEVKVERFERPYEVEMTGLWTELFPGRILQGRHHLVVQGAGIPEDDGPARICRLAWFNNREQLRAFRAPKAKARVLVGFTELLGLGKKSLTRLLTGRIKGAKAGGERVKIFFEQRSVKLKFGSDFCRTGGARSVVVLLLLADRWMHNSRTGGMLCLSGKDIAFLMNALLSMPVSGASQGNVGRRKVFLTSEAEEWWNRCDFWVKRLRNLGSVKHERIKGIVGELRKKIEEKIGKGVPVIGTRRKGAPDNSGYHLAAGVSVDFGLSRG